jgi:signal transduction histidine kinase
MESTAEKKAPRQRLNLGVQLLLGLVVLAAVVAVVAGSVIHANETKYLSSLVAEEKAKIFKLIASSTLDNVISEDMPQIETTMRQVIDGDPELIALTISNEEGSVLFGWQRRANGPAPMFAFWKYEPRIWSLATPIDIAGETFGEIHASWDVSRSDREVTRHTFLIVITVGGVCGLLSLLVYFLISTFAIKPIDQISSRVRGFRKGVYTEEVKLPAFASEELSQLNQSVDSLGRFLVEWEKRAAELKQAKELAETANRAKTAFLATMSHELRTPLNAINGFSEIMSVQMFGPLGDSRYQDYAEQINNSGNHLLALINDILDLSKVEAGKSELNTDEVEAVELITSAAELMRERARQDGLDYVVDISPDLPIMEADGRRVKQVLFNLLSNAIKFTPDGGRVTVSARWDAAAGIVIAISDTGIGIAHDELETAFEPFGQIESVYTRKYDGTGLGLPLAKALVKMHGGDLVLESEVDVGTTARFNLPADLAIAPSADSEEKELRATA